MTYLLLGLGLLLAGVTLGYLFASRVIFARERRAINAAWIDVAHYHEQFWQRQQLDDTRLGITIGTENCIAEVRNTLDTLEAQRDEP